MWKNVGDITPQLYQDQYHRLLFLQLVALAKIFWHHAHQQYLCLNSQPCLD